jgi:hypothetical protein
MVVMKKQRILGILVIVTLMSVHAEAGWIGDFGHRLIEGAKNAAKNNLQNKINRSIDNAMDGKLGKQQKSTNSIKGKNEYQGSPERSISKSGSDVEYEKIDSSGMLDLSVVKRRALPITGKYQEIDLGTFKFQGERLYGETLHMGEQVKDLNFYLMPGLYLVTLSPRSYNHDISVEGMHQDEGIEFGYGINLKRYIVDNGLYTINGNKGGTAFIIEVSKNGGHFQMFMYNDESRGGALEFSIFKIPDSAK